MSWRDAAQRVLFVSALAILALTSGRAFAEPPITDPARAGVPLAEASPLGRAVLALRAARGVEQYAALRNLFRQWDQADPADVEEAIVQFEQDPEVCSQSGCEDDCRLR